MKILIHDLGTEFDELFKNKADSVISANGQYAPCQGCFKCWTKHPAECFMKDSLHRTCREIGKADELIIVTENFYGAYSSAVKNILDRIIGLSTPLSTYRSRQMHHTLRYGKKEMLIVYTYGDITPEEKTTFEYMVERNAINYGFRSFKFVCLKNVQELERMTI